MHVIHLYDGHEQVYQGRGSVPGVVWNLARETAAAGHEVTVIERQWDGLPTREEHDGVRFHRLDLHTGASEPWTRVPYEEATSALGLGRLVVDRTNFALRALARLRPMDADVLHVHLPFAANVVATLAPGLSEKMVYTAHLGELRLDILEDGQAGDDESGPDVPSILSAFSPDVFLVNRVARTTVLNPNIRNVFVNRGVEPESLRVIPNGVETDRFGEVAAEDVERVAEAYAGDDRPVLLFIGTVIPRKGVTELVRAVDTVVNDRGRDLTVLVAGESDLDEAYTDRVRGLIEDNGLTQHVTLTGFVPAADLASLYTLADVFVVPSLEEGFGMTAIEAMAAGTPVVGTRVGGLPEIIEPGRTGALAPPGDVPALADAIDETLSMIHDSESQVETAARSTATRYSWDAIASQFHDVYAEVNA